MALERVNRSQEGGLLYKKGREGGGGGSSYLLGLKNAGFVHLGVFSLKRSIAGSFTVPFTVLIPKKYNKR